MDIENKQKYLRTEIIDKNYDIEVFLKFFTETVKTEEINLEEISMKKLEDVIFLLFLDCQNVS